MIMAKIGRPLVEVGTDSGIELRKTNLKKMTNSLLREVVNDCEIVLGLKVQELQGYIN